MKNEKYVYKICKLSTQSDHRGLSIDVSIRKILIFNSLLHDSAILMRFPYFLIRYNSPLYTIICVKIMCVS